MHKDLKYKLIRSKRKTYSISVSSLGDLVLKVPNQMKQKEIDAILIKHRAWIDSTLENRLKLNKNNDVQALVDFNEVLLLGKRRKIIFDGEKPSELNEDELIINVTYKERTELFIKYWLQNYAKYYLTNRTKDISEKVGLDFQHVKLSQARKRWGSCSTVGNINLAWRLIMATPIVIDSVILHELAHTKYMDHSKNFYYLLDSIDKNREQSDRWLLENSYLLNLY